MLRKSTAEGACGGLVVVWWVYGEQRELVPRDDQGSEQKQKQKQKEPHSDLEDGDLQRELREAAVDWAIAGQAEPSARKGRDHRSEGRDWRCARVSFHEREE